jgi:hypothetical protein
MGIQSLEQGYVLRLGPPTDGPETHLPQEHEGITHLQRHGSTTGSQE